MMIRLGLVQAASCENAVQNLETIRSFAAQAAEAGCSALCFPEGFLTGYFPERAAELAIPADAPALNQVSALAARFGLDLLVGFMEEKKGRCHLTHGVFRPDGSCDLYRKTHLGQKEQRFFAPGDHLDVFSLTSGLNAGFQLCVETHFPEITQTLSLKGAEVIFAPHAIPKVSGSRREIWSKFIPARSYDNRVYMACCNLRDSDRFGGGCLVTSPGGDVIASCFEDTPALLTFDVDREAVSRYHGQSASMRSRYYPGMRRPELYQIEDCI